MITITDIVITLIIVIVGSIVIMISGKRIFEALEEYFGDK